MLQNKKLFLTLGIAIFAVVAIAITYFFIPPVKYWTGTPAPTSSPVEEKSFKIGAVVDTDIQSPHPYPNSSRGTKLVWTHILSHPGATSLSLHFKKIELHTYQKLINKGETEVRAVLPVKGVDAVYPNNISIFPEDMEKVLSRRSGDYIIVRDVKRNIVAMVGGFCPHASLGYQDECLENGEGFWLLQPVEGETAIIELYADEKENGFGVYIDKYARGFTDEERKRVNQETTDQYLRECKEHGIPPEKCIIPK